MVERVLLDERWQQQGALHVGKGAPLFSYSVLVGTKDALLFFLATKAGAPQPVAMQGL